MLRKPIFWSSGDNAYRVVNTVDDVIHAYGFQGNGVGIMNVNATELDGLDSQQFIRSDVADTMEGILTITNFDGGKIIIKATAADETAGDVKLVDIQSAANVSIASIDSEGDIICRNLQVNGSETVVDTIVSTGLTVNGPIVGTGSVTLGNGNDAVAVNAGTGNFTIAAANAELNAAGALTGLTAVGSAGVPVTDGYFTNLSVTNLSVGAVDVNGTISNVFTVNIDNASDDTEDGILAFERGVLSPNAMLTWNSAVDQFDFNFGVAVTGNIAGTTIGGILQANLLDLAADEIITGKYTFAAGANAPVISELDTSALRINNLGDGMDITDLSIGPAVSNTRLRYNGDLGIFFIGGDLDTVKLEDGISLIGGGTGSTLTGFTSVRLPLQYHINDVQTSANVTAANLNTLTAGAASVADALHTHTMPSGTDVANSYTAFASYTLGQPVYISANNVVTIANASGIATARVIGFTKTSVAGGNAVDIVSDGLITGVATGWTAGNPVYLGLTAGTYTQTVSGYGAGNIVIQVGIAKNATDLQIQIGSLLVLA